MNGNTVAGTMGGTSNTRCISAVFINGSRLGVDSSTVSSVQFAGDLFEGGEQIYH